MNFRVDVECSPEEARRFLGLPDVTALHDIYLDKMKRMVDEGVTPDLLEQMMRAWGPMNDMSMKFWRTLFEKAGPFSKG
ncbi:DUF6489 family protein [Sphingomonas sp. ID0503]|uniref:DUF6489 family protein n=1 Tax=Sphingomonas sp. ID0503 TaxID=3399691 RepID=UPI003AFB757B